MGKEEETICTYEWEDEQKTKNNQQRKQNHTIVTNTIRISKHTPTHAL